MPRGNALSDELEICLVLNLCQKIRLYGNMYHESNQL